MSALDEFLNDEKYQPELYDDDGWKLLEQARSELAYLRAAVAERDAAIARAVHDEQSYILNLAPVVNVVKTENILGWDDMSKEERRMWKAGYMCSVQDWDAAIRARGEAKE